MKALTHALFGRALAAVLALALVATACGGSDAATVSAAGQDGPQSFEDLDQSSPIGEFLGFDFGNNDDTEAMFAEMEREAGRLTAACMLEKGFEYTPQDMSDFSNFGPGGDLPYFSAEWVEKYGFGITTQRFPQSSVGELVGYPDEERFGGPDEDFVDPNAEYVDALSDGEREAYQEALWGQPPDFGSEGPPDDFEYEPTGCQNESFDKAFSQGPGGNFEEFIDTFGDALEAMEDRADSHPDVVAFNSKVSECVSEAGMTWVDQQALYEQFESRLNALQPNGFGPGGGDPFEAAGVDPEEMSERELDEFFRDLQRLPPDKIDELAALQTEELELAKVVIGCGGGPLNEQIVLGDVRIQLEQEFLDQNASALAEFKPAG